MLNVGVSQVVPVLPVLASDMQLGATGIGMLIATPALARLALNLPLGQLADTVGRVPLMKYGTLATSLGCVGTGLSMPYGLVPVLLSRLLIGAGSGASMTGSSAMMADLTDAAPQHGGVVVFNLQDVPLGFGILAQPTAACKDLDPTASVVLHQADVGEYLRLESTLF